MINGILLIYTLVAIFIFIKSGYQYYKAMRATPILNFTTGDLITITWISILWGPVGIATVAMGPIIMGRFMYNLTKDHNKVLIAASKKQENNQ